MNQKQMEERYYKITDDDDDDDDDEGEGEEEDDDDMNFYDEDESLLEDQAHNNNPERSTQSANTNLTNNNNNNNNSNTSTNNNHNRSTSQITNYHSRGPYERAWSTEATRALIHIRGPMEAHFSEGRHRRTALWLQCTRQLQKMGYRYNAAKVQKKWHNILITYNKNLNKKYTTGHVNWDFFEDMFKYLKGKRADCYNIMTTATATATAIGTATATGTGTGIGAATITRTATAAATTIAKHRGDKYTINDMHSTLTVSQRHHHHHHHHHHQQQQQQVNHQQLQSHSLPLYVELDTKSNDDYDEENNSADLITGINDAIIEVKQEQFEQNVNLDSLAITNVCGAGARGSAGDGDGDTDGGEGGRGTEDRNDASAGAGAGNSVVSTIDKAKNHDILESKPLKITCSETSSSTTFLSLKYQKNTETNDAHAHHHHHPHHHRPIHSNEHEHEHNMEYVNDHENWWQEYFKQKLKMEHDKIELQKQMHHELMQFNKMSLVQQEKIERIKIDAINNLTNTLQKLVEIKYKKT